VKDPKKGIDFEGLTAPISDTLFDSPRETQATRIKGTSWARSLETVAVQNLHLSLTAVFCPSSTGPPFSSVMVCMSPPVFVIAPLLSHDSAKGTRAAHLSKLVPIT
jgi:hypothetical protein